MNNPDIIIVGAGAAGLMAARELSNAGFKVQVLEARNRTGGRIHTITDNLFPSPIELGAEFVHGDLELTKKIAKEAKTKLHVSKGELWRLEQGQFIGQDDFITNVEEVIDKLKKLPEDISVTAFLDTYFPGDKYVILRKSLKNFVEGYDAADAKFASSFALLQELLSEDEHQYRIEKGYQSIIDFLFSQCELAGSEIRLETIIKEIHWKTGLVEAVDDSGNRYVAKKIIITVPLGILQAGKASKAAMRFYPALSGISTALDSLGYGTVIKAILNFNEPIWKATTNTPGMEKSAPGFIFSDAVIPTWWTQMPEKNGMMTGWLAGPNATRLEHQSDENIFHLALESLAVIFQIPRKTLQTQLTGYHIYNWSNDEFALGAYGYETVSSKNAKTLINDGVEDSLFFAGEAYFQGAERGTVEAALVSGHQVAQKIIKASGL